MSGRGYVPGELLGRLVGRRLNAVVFSMDVVMLWFDGDERGSGNVTLHCDYPPEVEYRGVRRRERDAGYADALRRLIPEEVTGTVEKTGTGLVVRFASGRLVIHPSREERWGYEIATLSGFADRSWMCWRPGEDGFEDLA
ncbi:hypothetical protein [Gulosibacter sp. 10]|uniref:hypothetical protein n=1 Tax=Gulosibacter sp. 10 TaxID=1255570 RepID=UPI00097EE9F1|nr:hypothetical protein [Gulosibacter sp. 10]SJM55300.1 hypothetical protein FM112_03980 [Gulosibacter sp. 10]